VRPAGSWSGLSQASDHSAHAAATFHIDKRKTVNNEIVSHVHHIRFWEEDDAIAIGVAVWEMNGANVFAIEMDSGAVVESDDRKGLLWRRRNRLPATVPPPCKRLRTFS
jgi:hypothetical protein